MSLRTSQILIPLASLFVGGAFGYWAGIRRASQPAPEASTAERSSPAKPEREGSQATSVPENQLAPSRDLSLLSLDQAFALKGSDRLVALKQLLARWIASQPDADERQRLESMLDFALKQPNPILAISSLLGADFFAPHRAEWQKACAGSPVRSLIFAELAAMDSDAPAQSLPPEAEKWLPWEKASYLEHAMNRWVNRNPSRALAWLRENPDTPNRAALTQIAMGILGSLNDVQGVQREYDLATTPEARVAAVRALAAAKISDTRQAVEWADSLPDGPERDAAHEVLYELTPRGVGAILALTDDGLPNVNQLVPGGPLEKSGFLKGDTLVGFTRPDGTLQTFAGQPLEQITGQLRGAPGTPIDIIAMRLNPTTGQREEIRTTVVRQQILFQETAENRK